MKKKITSKWLRSENACVEGLQWFKLQQDKTTLSILEQLKKERKFGWLNWLIAKLLVHEQRIKYAVYAAKQVIHIYEDRYPNDKRPREAIEAAQGCIKNSSKENKKIVGDAAAYAAEATETAYTDSADAGAATRSAVYAAYAASAIFADNSNYTVNSVFYAVRAVHRRAEMALTITNYGIKLLKKENL